MSHTRVAAAVLALAVVVAHGSSVRGVFVADDLLAIVQNPHLKRLWPISAPEQSTLAGRPVAAATFSLTYAITPADVRDHLRPSPTAGDRYVQNLWWYHAGNILIHVLAALALFGVIRRSLMVRQASSLEPRAASLVAAAIALLWAVHPLTTAAVTYVVQRVESLMSLFYLLTLYGAIRYFTEGRRRWALMSVAACALGMATKETMVTAPLAVAAWWWIWHSVGSRRTSGSRGLSPRTFGLALASAWIVLAALIAGAPRSLSVGWTVDGWTPWTYLLTQAGVIVHYLRLAVIPTPLVFDYGWPRLESFAAAAPALIVLTAAAAATAFGVWRRQRWAFPAAVFFLGLAPSSSVLPIATEVAADHRMYLPLAALIALAVVVAAGVFRTLGFSPRSAVTSLVAAVLVIVPIETMATWARNRDYRSAESLWADTVAKRPQNANAHHNYALELLDAGRVRDAERGFRTAVALQPDLAAAWVGLGLSLCSQKVPDQGAAALDRALAIGNYTEAERISARAKLIAVCLQRGK